MEASRRPSPGHDDRARGKRRPFLYFPLARHCEQPSHVAHRLERYGDGRRMRFSESPPETIAAAICDGLLAPTDYRRVDGDGAQRATALIAELL